MIDTSPEPPLTAHAQVIESKLLDCELKAGEFSVRYEDDLDGFEIVISSTAGAASSRFRCIFNATYPEFVRFDDLAVHEQYRAFADEEVRPQVLANLERELRIAGLWDGFPKRGSYSTLEGYVRALEAHTGFTPGTMAQVDGEAHVTFNPPLEGVKVLNHPEHLAKFWVVLLFASARDGFDLGFFGNDKVRE